MSRNSEIGWTHHTANPWWGCTKISPACDHCYAATFSGRLSASLFGERVVWGPGGNQVHKMDDVERDARAWNLAARKAHEHHRVFCGSMCDWAEGRSDQVVSLERLFPLIASTSNLNWLLLTKRPNIGKRLLASAFGSTVTQNIWVGATIENQEWADKRVPHLLEIDAAVRFVSVEPQLGPVDLSQHLGRGPGKINWVIAGGESGAGARGYIEMLAWYRSIRDQCIAASVPFFFKQWGRFAQDGETLYRLRGKNPLNVLDGVRWEQYPDDVRAPLIVPARPLVRSKYDRLLDDSYDLLSA
jgi:protein gp37